VNVYSEERKQMSDNDHSLLEEAKQRHAESVARLDELNTRIKALPDDASTDEVEFLRASFEKEKGTAKRWAEAVERTGVILDARNAVRPQNADDPDAKPQRIEVKEPLTYRQNGPHSFFRDQFAAAQGDGEAAMRLQRHSQEMRVEMRDLSGAATAGGEFVPPTYLNDQWITLARSGRVTANLMQSRQLPPNTMTIHFPVLSTGSATAVQASPNSGVQETDPVTADYSIPVVTIAGQVDMSRQLFERSTPGMDEIVFADLAADYATKLNVQVISGAGTTGYATGLRTVSSIISVAYTDSSPTVAELYPKIASAWSQIATGLYRNADAIVMHPRRWAMFQGAVDSTGRPLASAEAPMNAIARGRAVVTEGLAGSIQGLPVYVDPSIPTNLGSNTREDVILVLRTSEMYLYEEGAPRTRVFEDVGSNTITIRLQLFGYFAFAGGRYPSAIATIGGTGMDPPTF
jgi:HK97 family phage major capsid protein